MALRGPSVSISNLSKHWGSVTALDELTLNFEAGAFTAILGPSGCGKSTLLRLLAGLEKASSGTISIEDRDVTRLSPTDRNISMVFQNYALFPHLDVAENILFGLRVRRVPKAMRQKKLEEAAELLDLTQHLQKRPSQLSGGQQQRVALARAIVGDRSIVLMDEPLSNLDAKLRAEMRVELRDLQRRLGITLIYVTHDQLEAVTMADHVLLLNAGRVEQYDNPKALYKAPQTLFAAGFIGTPKMNLVPARILHPNSPPELDGIVAGVRPEAIVLNSSGAHEAEIHSQEFYGADTMMTLRIGEHQLIARTPADGNMADMNASRFDFDTKDLHLFDEASGQRSDKNLVHFGVNADSNEST